MIINNNISARKSCNALRSVNTSLQQTIRSLSTGLRINSSADDAAGFAVSEKMRSQIAGLDVAIRNTQDASSLLQTAEGGMSSANSLLQRMRELSVQAASDSLTSQDRQYLQLEIDELKGELDRIADTTQFNRRRILDGSAGASWSSDDLAVKARINAPLEGAGGSYRLEVTAEPGIPQVQTSRIMTVHREETKDITDEGTMLAGYKAKDVSDIDISVDTVTASGKGWSLQDGIFRVTENGTYSIIGKRGEDGTAAPINARILVEPGVEATVYMKDVNITATGIDGGIPGGCAFYMAGAKVDLYVDGENYLTSGPHRSGLEASAGSELTISSAGGDFSTRGVLNIRGGEHGAGIGGACGNSGGITKGGSVTIKGGTITAQGGTFASGIGGGWGADFENVTIEGGIVAAIGGRGAAGIGSGAYEWNSVRRNTGTIEIIGSEVSARGGAAIGNYAGGAGIGGGGGSASGNITINENLSVDASSIGGGLNVPSTSTITYDDTQPEVPRIEDFSETTQIITPEPASIAEALGIAHTETLTITQGDGQTAEVTLYPSDTVYEMAEKINGAIADGLGQAKYADSRENFCTISREAGRLELPGLTSTNIEDIPHTDDESGILTETLTTTTTYADISAGMVIRSAIPGRNGELFFSGSEELLSALGLNTTQEASESVSTAYVYDTVTGKAIVSGARAEGTEFVSLIPPEIDIEVDPMAGLVSNWDESTQRFMTARHSVYTAMLNIKNNGTIFQTGANRGEDFCVELSSVSCDALGVLRVNVLTRETAGRAITLVDRAISKLSAKRAQIGAYSNALEHTASNLTTESAQLTGAESRIRDADMASTMIQFTKLNILNQSDTSMLAQANQLPQSVLSLFS